MSPSKSAFQRNEALCKQWAAVAKATWFQEVLIYARSELMERAESPEQIKGATLIIDILGTLSDAEEPHGGFPRPKLQHDLVGDIAKARTAAK